MQTTTNIVFPDDLFDRLLTVDEVAHICQIEASEVEHAASVGELLAMRFSSSGLRISRKALHEWLDRKEGSVPPPPAPQAPPVIHRLLDRDGVAKLLGVSPSGVTPLVRSGQLVAVRIGRVLRFDPADVRAFIDAQKTSIKEQPVTNPGVAGQSK